MKRKLATLLTLSLLLGLASAALCAEEIVETWRSPLGTIRDIAVDPADRSVWLCSGGSLVHTDHTGTILLQVDGLYEPVCVSGGVPDGSCWVADDVGHRLVRVGTDGSILVEIELPQVLTLGHYRWSEPRDLGVDPSNGSCWIALVTPGDEVPDEVRHFAADGTELWRGEFSGTRDVAVDPRDGSCWVVDDPFVSGVAGALVHVAADGEELWRGEPVEIPGHLHDVAVSPTDGSCWVGTGGYENELVHLAADGTELWRTAVLARYVSVNPVDGSVWASSGGADAPWVSHVAADGTILWQSDRFAHPSTVAVDPGDSSVWLRDASWLVRLASDATEIWRSEPMGGYLVADPSDGSCLVFSRELSRVAPDGTLLWESEPLNLGDGGHVRAVAHNATDGSWWVSKFGEWDNDLHTIVGSALIHLDADGTELLRIPDVSPLSISVNSADSSVWTAGFDVVHRAADGTELWRGSVEPLDAIVAAVDSVSGACWVIASSITSGSDEDESWLIYFTEDGTEQWREELTWGVDLSVDPTNGTCWVADEGVDSSLGRFHQAVYLFSAEGTLVWRTEDSLPALNWPRAVSANPEDGSCWVADLDHVHHLSPSGEMATAAGFHAPMPMSCSPHDGSCWVNDAGNGQLVRLEVRFGFSDVPVDHWASEDIGACVEAGIVAGYADGLYRPDVAVTRDQMAVYISRALAGGDENVPAFGGTPSFPDVDETHWALDYVEYAVEQNVVAGYADGTYHPEYEVTRDQMAVYVARALVAPTGEAALADYVPADPRNFPDVSSDSWAYTHIEYCVEHGVVQGYEDGYYHPEIVVTRDQMAVYVARAFGLAS
jgi:hypothetical protein